ncbi:TlpA family protein disulfide reductase [Pontibacter akesuensis]|uniref:Peroxiredoxin n=1 Tax=Pontibacter akesuensis TaxID=388950 RepID=A0A1I7FGQ7_9BACT|nr:TlpA disulfide reductase family protein [Pontibacter akesuensis]SFU35295.1 Peroxiredoxin [Pontibacter akesuensis]
MKRIKYFFIIVFLPIILFSCGSKKSMSESLKAKLDNLELASTNDLLKLGTIKWNADTTPVYDLEGNRLTQASLTNAIKSNRFKQEFYFDAKRALKAVVMIPLDEKELGWNIKKKEGEILIGQKSPQFHVTDINGKSYTRDSLAGKVVVINTWFAECKPCIEEIPDLNRLVQDFKGEDVVFLGFARNDQKDILKFLGKREFNYQHIAADSELFSSFYINVYPTNILVDRNSRITFYETSLNPDIYIIMKNQIERALAEG